MPLSVISIPTSPLLALLINEIPFAFVGDGDPLSTEFSVRDVRTFIRPLPLELLPSNVLISCTSPGTFEKTKIVLKTEQNVFEMFYSIS